MRTCEGCGTKMPNFHPRKRDASGKLVCDACASGRSGGGSVVGSFHPAGIIHVAHGAGEGETLYHCPFCGAGGLYALSDGTTKCQYCGRVFTVQMQPEQMGMPQTIDGQPQQVPGMPGQPENQGGPQAQEVAGNPAQANDMAIEPGPEDQPSDKAKAEDDQGDDASKAITPHPADPKSEKAKTEDDKGPASKDTESKDGDDNPFAKKDDSKSDDKKDDGKKDSDHKPPWLKGSKRYYLVEGGVLDEDSFLRRLAIEHADDRATVLASVREDRQRSEV